MTTLRNLFLATAFAAALPAMAAPTPVTIDFELTATVPAFDLDGNLIAGTGDGQAVGGFYAADGVTFDSNAYSFYSILNSNAFYGKWVDTGDVNNTAFMSPFQVSPATCFADRSTPGCTTSLPSISTIATITKPYVRVDFLYSADTGSDGNVYFGLKSSTGATSSIALTMGANSKFSDNCEPSSQVWWCQWNPISFVVPTGYTLQTIEFRGREGAIFYDNIVLTPPTPVTIPVPEPSTYALTLFGLVGIRFLAVRRRRPD